MSMRSDMLSALRVIPEVTEEARQAVIQYEKDRLKSEKRLKEMIKYTFRNGDVLTVTYELKKAGDDQ